MEGQNSLTEISLKQAELASLKNEFKKSREELAEVRRQLREAQFEANFQQQCIDNEIQSRIEIENKLAEFKNEDAEKERAAAEQVAKWEAEMQEEMKKSEDLLRQIELEMEQFAIERADLRYFCFGADFVLTIESIVRGCFANINRSKFSCARVEADQEEFPLSPDFTTAESVLDKVKDWSCTAKFDEEKIKIYSTQRLRPEINFQKWLDDLKEMRWYGPYQEGTVEEDTLRCLYFKTATEAGEQRGFILQVTLTCESLDLYYKDEACQEVGDTYNFW